jgi:hypothetical protein
MPGLNHVWVQLFERSMHVPGGLKTERKNQFDRRLPAKNYYSLVNMAAVLTAALLPVA